MGYDIFKNENNEITGITVKPRNSTAKLPTLDADQETAKKTSPSMTIPAVYYNHTCNYCGKQFPRPIRLRQHLEKCFEKRRVEISMNIKSKITGPIKSKKAKRKIITVE